MSSLFAALDAQLDALFAGWNVWSTTLIVVLIAVLLSPLFFSSESDAHPFLLARQASASPVRKSGESAVYRSLDIPHGYPLRSGLNIKDGSSKWGPGRDGDLRDIWLAAVKSEGGKAGKILRLRGNNAPVSSSLEDLSKQINVIGKQLQSQGAQRIAIYLPNSTEFLVSLFACVFYGLTPVLLPQDLSLDQVAQYIRETKADSIIASAGVVSEDDVNKVLPNAKLAIFVASSSSQQLEFAETNPLGSAQHWHSLIEQGAGSVDLPSEIKDVPNVLSIWQSGDGQSQIVEYTQTNIISAVAAQLAVLPRNHTLQETDVLVSLESLASSFPLVVTLAGLYSGAYIALTSVAGQSPDYALAFQGNLKATIVIASSATIAKSHAQQVQQDQGFFQRLHKSRHAGYLAAGTMRAVSPQSARLIYISETPSSVPLSPQDLNDVRIFNGSRIIHALTLPQVAGAVAQSSSLDYRIAAAPTKRAHFGAVLSSLEAKVVEGRSKISDDNYVPSGQLVLNGPAVVGKGEVQTGVEAKFNDDLTLQLL